MMKPWVAAIFATMAMACAAAESGLVAAPSANDSCVKLLPGSPTSPAYPVEMFESKLGGSVRVELEFGDANSEPQVRHLHGPVEDLSITLLEAVKKFARAYRNSCMKPGDPAVRVRQEFVFAPNDGRKVTWTVPAPANTAGDKAESRCVAHVLPGSRPEYPARAFEAGVSGRVVLKVRFEALNAPPKLSLLVPPARRELGLAVLRWAEGYRLTCGTPPLEAMQVFQFAIAEGQRPVLRDAPLLTFLGATRNATERPVFFDLNAMGCPFDVRIRYWQPFLRNDVGQVAGDRPERRTFLDWLAGLQLNIDQKTAADVAGDEFTVAIPCGKIDL